MLIDRFKLDTPGQRAAVATSIDRRSYNVARDLNAATGSITDVMRNVPSVSVDLEGNVSLRGKTGSIQTVGATAGRLGIAALGTYAKDKLSLSGSLSARTQTLEESGVADSTRIDTIAGLRTDTVGANAGENEQGGVAGSITAEYQATKADRLTFGLSVSVPGSERFNHYHEVRLDAGGAIERDYTIDLTGSQNAVQAQLSAGWRHTFAQAGRELSITARHTDVTGTSKSRLVYTYAIPTDVDDVRRHTENDNWQQLVTALYVHPLPGNAVLKLGYDYRRDAIGQDVRGEEVDDVTGLPVDLVNFTNHFVFVDRNHQPWATFQKPFGKLTVLAGLRLEYAQTDYDQRTTAIRGEEDFNDVHPTLHLQYNLSDTQTLITSYSHRVTRPSQGQRNPFLAISNEFNASTGNPALRPQETHSVEAGWRWQKGPSNFGAAFYYRQNYNTIVQVNSFLTPQIILSTYENLGDSTSGGVDLNAGGKVGAKLTWRANANLSHQELQRSALGGGGTRSADAYTVNGVLEYRATDKDLIQIAGNYAGKQINAQGYRLPTGVLNMGYQRKFRPDLIGIVAVSDIFDSNRQVTVQDTTNLYGTNYSRVTGRTFIIGLTRTFGGRPAREGQFEFDAPAG